MSIRAYGQLDPRIATTAYIDPDAVVIGDVTIGEEASVWPTAVLRGDVQRIVVGPRTSIQDGSVLHVTHDGPYSPGGRACLVGVGVTVGHRVILHACTVGDYCLIGMGAILMDDVAVGDECLIAAGSLVPPGKILPPRTLWRGSPAEQVRELDDEAVEKLRYSAAHYVRLGRRYRDADVGG